MENVTGKLLSFIVNNSSLENVSDGFFTLYANEPQPPLPAILVKQTPGPLL